MELLDKIRYLVNRDDATAFLATGDPQDARLEVCIMNSARMHADDTITCALVAAPHTYENLLKTKKGLLVVLGPAKDPRHIYGARVHLELLADFTEGEEYHEMQEFVNQYFGDYPVSHRLLFRAVSAEPSWEV
ncbi:MAG: hypothetical protein NTW26_10405 [bacterium]|nr:hypothetical protein [bacterium]